MPTLGITISWLIAIPNSCRIYEILLGITAGHHLVPKPCTLGSIRSQKREMWLWGKTCLGHTILVPKRDKCCLVNWWTSLKTTAKKNWACSQANLSRSQYSSSLLQLSLWAEKKNIVQPNKGLHRFVQCIAISKGHFNDTQLCNTLCGPLYWPVSNFSYGLGSPPNLPDMKGSFFHWSPNHPKIWHILVLVPITLPMLIPLLSLLVLKPMVY